MSDPRRLFSIGEFSRVTAITVKALRFYQDEGLLPPTFVDAQSGYRYYDPALIERARVIVYLRSLEFPLDQIPDILQHAQDYEQLLAAMGRHKTEIESRIRELRGVVRSLNQFITEQREAKVMSSDSYHVQEKQVDPLLVAGVRMKGRYSDCSKGFSKIGRSFGRFIAGPCFLLHYDSEYREDDADFEACMPVKQSKSVDGVSVRELPACKCVCLVHRGPYDTLGPSYAKVLKHVKDKGYAISSPTREMYLKGPGMIFKGNPKNYLTEIQIPIQPSA